MQTLVVTRHPALVEYLKEQNIIDDNANVLTHATPERVTGKRVVGVLPIHLAALTSEYVNVGLFTPQELRGVELTLEQVRQYAQPAVTYKVEVVS